ncbi:MAG TPA: toll/interleukin-1 receptor domain-containing protein [Ktedonobacteraceae bacterium]|nr:toll/interleukin-1 receptor domain-containing protein [Ktedonobacteraceae bacterium]
MPEPLDVFFSYAHVDKDWQKKIEASLSTLKRQGFINIWTDRSILAGDEWEAEILGHLDASPIILLLISRSFIDSDYCWNVELTKAMKLHDIGKARVIPIIIRPTDWKETPLFRLQALPKDGKPITTWSNTDKALQDVANGIRMVVEKIRETPPQVTKELKQTNAQIPYTPDYTWDAQSRDIIIDWLAVEYPSLKLVQNSGTPLPVFTGPKGRKICVEIYRWDTRFRLPSFDSLIAILKTMHNGRRGVLVDSHVAVLIFPNDVSAKQAAWEINKNLVIPMDTTIIVGYLSVTFIMVSTIGRGFLP